MTTDAPVSFITDEITFVVEQPLTLLLGPDESLTEPVDSVAREIRSRTESYWREFVRHLAVPLEWQEAVIRAAITLQLCSFEETGAVPAAMTTSIPEAPDSGRNWDYRFCWLRDSHFVVQALNRLGATRTMEGYLGYITNLAAAAKGGVLQPVYGIKFERDLTERTVDNLPGYRGMGPVRVGNAAWRQLQNDNYGSAILAVTVESLEPLRDGSNFFRYQEDKLGAPATSFAVCSFWYIDAINALGRHEEARDLFEQMLERRNPVGLLSENLDPETGELWGNFPQTYSMVGLINSALRLSRPWSEAF